MPPSYVGVRFTEGSESGTTDAAVPPPVSLNWDNVGGRERKGGVNILHIFYYTDLSVSLLYVWQCTISTLF